MPDRTQFLHTPRHPSDTQFKGARLRRIQQTQDLLRKTFHPNVLPPHHRAALLLEEARSSSAIEGVFDQDAHNTHHQALTAFIKGPVDKPGLLKMHRTMFQGKDYAQPGRYRTIHVEVGRYRPPPPREVPDLMDEFFYYVNLPGRFPIVQAAWAHIQFETIHPFADGNGRTGRAVITNILDAPLPLSTRIYLERPTYYALLDSGEWLEYLDWFTHLVAAQTKESAKGLPA